MKESERRLWDKAALTAFGAILLSNGSRQGNKEVANAAYKAASAFLTARRESLSNQYDAIFREYNGLDALRRVLELGGNTGRCLDYMVERYADKPDPLRSFAEKNIGYRTQGQIAVSRFLEKQGRL
jgi:hypothetical protein